MHLAPRWIGLSRSAFLARGDVRELVVTTVIVGSWLAGQSLAHPVVVRVTLGLVADPSPIASQPPP